MTFLNFIMLGGLAAASVPILIHLLHRNRPRTIKWGAMHLLDSVIRTNRRRIKIEQLILLAIRTAIVVLLALCMGRPVLTGMRALLGGEPASLAVLLDNSYSMESGAPGHSNYSSAIDSATQAIEHLRRGSEASVLMMGEAGTPMFDEPTTDTARLAQTLAKTDAEFGVADVPVSLENAIRALDKMHNASRDLLIMTDFQRLSWDASEAAARAQVVERLGKMPAPPRITLFHSGVEVSENVAIESLDFPRLMIGVGQEIQIRANVRNYGNASYPDLNVYFRVDGREKSTSQIVLGPHEQGQVLFTNTFETAGSHYIEIHSDAFPSHADNSFLASIPVWDKIPVLLVDGDPSPEPLKSATAFLQIALEPFGAGKLELSDLISSRVIQADELNAHVMSAFRVVVLANVRSLGDQQLREIEDYARNGGGVLIFPGNRIDPAWYNGRMADDGRGLLPLPLASLAGDMKESSISASIAGQHFDHPALELFNDPRNGNLSDATIRTWFKLKEPSGALPEGQSVLARLDTGDPFLAEKKFGDGLVIECAVPPDAAWSNLPMCPFYLPLMQRLCIYLASTVTPPRNIETGKPIVAFFDSADGGKPVRITDPTGNSTELKILKKGSHGVIEYGRTLRPGIYALTTPQGPVHYAVNVDRRESDLRQLTQREIEDVAKSMGASLVNNWREYEHLDDTRRYGREIWRWLLWSVLALVFIEVALEQKFARNKGAA